MRAPGDVDGGHRRDHAQTGERRAGPSLGAAPSSAPEAGDAARRAGGPGRGGAYSRSSSSATSPIVAASSVGAGIVRARVTVVQSSRRTLIPIVRPRALVAPQPVAQPRRELAEDRLQLARGRRCRRRRSSHATRDFASRTGSTVGESSKRARAPCSHGPWRAPKRSLQHGVVGVARARRASRCRARSGARRSSGRSPARAPAALRRSARTPARARGRRTRRGFSASDATLATSLLGPMPTDALMPGLLRIVGDQPRASPPSARRAPVEVEIRLVQPELLDEVHVRAHDRHDRARDVAR